MLEIKNNAIIVGFVILLLGCSNSKEIGIDLSSTSDTLQLFGENVVSTYLYERDLAISPKGDEIIFTLSNFKQDVRCLVSLKKENNARSKKKVLSFSGEYNDIEPFFDPRGNFLYFVSNRPIYGDSSRSDYNIWYVENTELGWGNARALDSIINTKGDEFFPAITNSGNLYFTATRNNGIGLEDIFVSKFMNGKYQEPSVLDTNINSKTYEFNAYVSPNEDLIVFSSYGRPDGYGGGDLYISTKDKQNKWSLSRNLGTIINSDKLDYCPFVDLENHNFYFTSDRKINKKILISTVDDIEKASKNILNGMGNIYRINANVLLLNN